MIIRGLGMIKKNSDEHIKKIPKDISLSNLQKILLLNTNQVLRKTISI